MTVKDEITAMCDELKERFKGVNNFTTNSYRSMPFGEPSSWKPTRNAHRAMAKMRALFLRYEADNPYANLNDDGQAVPASLDYEK